MKKTNQEKTSIKWLWLYSGLSQTVGIGIIVLGVLVLTQKPASSAPQLLVWLFLLIGAVFVFVGGGHRHRLIWVYKNISPVSMKMKLDKEESSDSTQYFAYLADETEDHYLWKASLCPSACLKSLPLNVNHQVQVYIDPKNNNPAVIKIAEGLLWVTAGSGTVQSLKTN